MNIMVRHTDMGISYAPLYVHSFPLVQPQCLVDAEKYNLAYSDLSEIDSTVDKLRWCRYRIGLLQRDVAAYAWLDRGTYGSYEEAARDLYPLDTMKKIAELLEVPLESWKCRWKVVGLSNMRYSSEQKTFKRLLW